MASITDRMVRAARLDAALYEEVEADATATGQAMFVVLLSSLAAGIGAVGEAGVRGLIAGAVGALIAWFIWAFLTYLIGTRLLPEPQTEADVGQLLRTTGFSSAPGILRIFGFIPLVGGLIQLVASVWMLVAMVIAIRQALDYRSTGRAVGVCLIGWIVQILFLVLVGSIFGILGRG